MGYAIGVESERTSICDPLIPKKEGRKPVLCKKASFLLFLPLFLLLFPLPSACAQPSIAFSATLIDFEGEVLIQKAGENLWLPVEKNLPLEQGDHIKTGAKGFVEILVDDGSQIRLEENSEITLCELSADFQTKSITASVYLWFGPMLSSIGRFAHSRSKFEVQTPTVVAGVRGTDFTIEVMETKQTDVGVFDGELAVAGLDRHKRPMRESEVTLGKGYQSSVFRNRPPGQPVQLRERMLSLAPHLEVLKNKGMDRRRDLPIIMEKRKAVHQETQKKWRAIKNERSNQMKNPELLLPKDKKTEPNSGKGQKAAPPPGGKPKPIP